MTIPEERLTQISHRFAELEARLALFDRDLDHTRRALRVDLDQRRIADLAEPSDRAAAIVVVADPRDQARPAAGHPQVQGDVGRCPAELRAVGEQVPQDFTPDNDRLVGG